VVKKMETRTMNLDGKVALAVVFGLVAIVAAAFGQESRGGGRLVGTWDAVVKIKDCNAGNVLNTISSIASFNQGGTSIGSTAGFPQSSRTPEHGIWRHVAGNTYAFKFKSYNFNSLGVAEGYVIVSHTIELDESLHTYSSHGTSTIYSMTGTQTGQRCSEAAGTRMTF
jgi:hypothetical protein